MLRHPREGPRRARCTTERKALPTPSSLRRANSQRRGQPGLKGILQRRPAGEGGGRFSFTCVNSEAGLCRYMEGSGLWRARTGKGFSLLGFIFSAKAAPVAKGRAAWLRNRVLGNDDFLPPPPLAARGGGVYRKACLPELHPLVGCSGHLCACLCGYVDRRCCRTALEHVQSGYSFLRLRTLAQEQGCL